MTGPVTTNHEKTSRKTTDVHRVRSIGLFGGSVKVSRSMVHSGHGFYSVPDFRRRIPPRSRSMRRGADEEMERRKSRSDDAIHGTRPMPEVWEDSLDARTLSIQAEQPRSRSRSVGRIDLFSVKYPLTPLRIAYKHNAQMRAKIHVKKDSEGLPEEIGFAVIINIAKPLRYAAVFVAVFVATTISELGK